MSSARRVAAMSVDYQRLCRNPAEAHHAAVDAYIVAKTFLAEDRAVWIKCTEHQDDRSVEQNSYYWGPCLTEISEQARVLGQRYTTEAWHELFKRQFLGFELVKVAVAGRKRLTVIRRLRSTTKLKVRAMSEYLEKVQAFAADDLGVRFSAPATAEYAQVVRPTKRQAAAPKAAALQPEEVS